MLATTTVHRLASPLLTIATLLGAATLGSIAYTTRTAPPADPAGHSDTAPLHAATIKEVPEGLDYSTTRLSNAGVYKVTYTPSVTPIPVNTLQTWTLHLETKEGTPVTNARIDIDGDMLQHGHGLPTNPEVTRNLGRGDYLIEGIKFQMGGWWVMDFKVTSAGRTDTVRFNLMLKE